MKRKLAVILSLVMIFTLALTACGSNTSNNGGGEEDNSMEGSVAMVLSGLITDEAFNQYTYEGMKRAEEELGIKTDGTIAAAPSEPAAAPTVGDLSE